MKRIVAMYSEKHHRLDLKDVDFADSWSRFARSARRGMPISARVLRNSVRWVCAAALLGAAACSSGEPVPAPLLTFSSREGGNVSQLMVYDDAKYNAWSETASTHAAGSLSAEDFAALQPLLKPNIACNDGQDAGVGAEGTNYETSLSLHDGTRCKGTWGDGSNAPESTRELLDRLRSILAEVL